jgi:hypothetical protein
MHILASGRKFSYSLHFYRSVNFYLEISSHIDTALHFTFYRNNTKSYSVMLMESVRFYIFFLVSYYFTKKAAGLLTLSHKYQDENGQ